MPEVKSSKTQQNIEGLTALYSGVSQNLSITHAADDAIENKTAAFLAGSLVVLTLVISKAQVWRALTFIGVGLLSLNIVLSIWVLWSRAYGSVAVKVEDNLDYLDMPNKELLLRIISDAEASNAESGKILIQKVKIYRYVLILFIVGTAFSLLSFYIKLSWIK